jgi:hypothetical protein
MVSPQTRRLGLGVSSLHLFGRVNIISPLPQLTLCVILSVVEGSINSKLKTFSFPNPIIFKKMRYQNSKIEKKASFPVYFWSILVSF